MLALNEAQLQMRFPARSSFRESASSTEPGQALGLHRQTPVLEDERHLCNASSIKFFEQLKEDWKNRLIITFEMAMRQFAHRTLTALERWDAKVVKGENRRLDRSDSSSRTDALAQVTTRQRHPCHSAKIDGE